MRCSRTRSAEVAESPRRIVLMLIGGLIAYSLVLAVVTVVRLRSINAAKSDLNRDLARNSAQALHKQWVGIRAGNCWHVLRFWSGFVFGSAIRRSHRRRMARKRRLASTIPNRDNKSA